LQKLRLRIQKKFLMSDIAVAYYKSPIGLAKIVGTPAGLESVSILEQSNDAMVENSDEIAEFLIPCIRQLTEYFEGSRKEFDLLYNLKGTDFQKKVWNSLLEVPYGKTRSYMEQAKTLGDVKAIRAVASANGKNPLWILIPCHRIIGTDGSLTGYAGGLWRKKWLLAHENPVKQESLF